MSIRGSDLREQDKGFRHAPIGNIAVCPATQPTSDQGRWLCQRPRIQDSAAGDTIRPKPDKLPVEPRQAITLPKRSRRYVRRPTNLSPRLQPARPSQELMHRVLDGLENLPEQSPSQGERDPQSGSETWF
jgi:hypothetical protein